MWWTKHSDTLHNLIVLSSFLHQKSKEMRKGKSISMAEAVGVFKKLPGSNRRKADEILVRWSRLSVKSSWLLLFSVFQRILGQHLRTGIKSTGLQICKRREKCVPAIIALHMSAYF